MIFHVLTSASLDPIVRWLLSGLRLWFFALSEEPDEEWVRRVATESKGRLGTSARRALKLEIEVTPRGFLVADRLVRTRELRSVCRKIFLNTSEVRLCEDFQGEDQPGTMDLLALKQNSISKPYLRSIPTLLHATLRCVLEQS